MLITGLNFFKILSKKDYQSYLQQHNAIGKNSLSSEKAHSFYDFENVFS